MAWGIVRTTRPLLSTKISTAANSMTRSPSKGGSPVVSVSKATIRCLRQSMHAVYHEGMTRDRMAVGVIG